MNVEEYTDEPATAEISVIWEPSIEYARNKEIPTFFGQPLVKGSFSHTRIVSPSQQSYIFYQYDEAHGYRITRPLNANLFIESPDDFSTAFERFVEFLGDLKKYQGPTTSWVILLH